LARRLIVSAGFVNAVAYQRLHLAVYSHVSRNRFALEPFFWGEPKKDGFFVARFA
jgi:hypothetical protein